jgi:signal transduction histidine kinase
MSSGFRSSDPADEARRAERLALFELGEDDRALLAALRPALEAAIDGVVADFYEHLLRFEPLRTLLTAEPNRIERLKRLQRAFVLEMADGRFDATYFESRLRVGDAHQRIGLEPEWYLGAFSRLLRLLLRRTAADAGIDPAALPRLEAVIKTVLLDASLAIDTYIHGGFVDRHVAARLEQAATVAEEALAARAEVERLKDDLTSMVVHDLKNPVNGIVMMVQLALRKGADLPAPHRAHLRQIERTCHEMLRLIQNLLEIAKIEEGEMPVSRGPVVLAEVVDDVVGEFDPVAAETRRKLLVDVPTTLPPALCDRLLLRRVLANLVVNALRHSGSPDVRIAAGTSPKDTVTLRVIDRGRGIGAGDQKLVFDKFRSARPSATDEPSPDTGLGLAFCRLAVECMGGTISLASEPGVETTFAVVLPAVVPGR